MGSTAGTFENHGTIRVDAGGRLNVSTPLANDGDITVENGSVLLQAFPQGAPISITDSTIYAGVFDQTLSQLHALPRTRSEFVAAATVNLEGQTLTLADADGQRWALGSGGFRNGRIASADGFELKFAATSGLVGTPVLSNLVLDADARVDSGHVLQINENVTGAGRLIVDGGTLRFGGRGNTGALLTSDSIARVDPQSGAAGSVVEIYGPLDNTGRTLYMKAGAQWRLDVLRSTGITGGRIEGDPGVELRIVQGYSDDLDGVTLAAPVRVTTSTAYVKNGITLDDAVVTIGDAANGQLFDAHLQFNGGFQTLGGTGEIRFDGIAGSPSNPVAPRINMLEVVANRLTIGPGVTLRTSAGDGYLGGAYNHSSPPQRAVLTNEGLLLAENGHTLSLFTVDFLQTGVLRRKPRRSSSSTTRGSRIAAASRPPAVDSSSPTTSRSTRRRRLPSSCLPTCSAPPCPRSR